MNIDDITNGTVTSPADLIDLYESLCLPQLSKPPLPWAFRGQSQAFGTLVPSFQRIFINKRSAGTAEIIELDLIDTFRKHYEKLQGRTHDMPLPHLINANFKLRCLSVMQHYGVPSRLLDWTTDFWTAVYFACAGDASKDAELWYYSKHIFNSQLSEPELASLLQPIDLATAMIAEPDLLSKRREKFIIELDPKITPRMRQQSAHHTMSTDIFADHAPLLYDLSQKDQPAIATNEKFFFRVIIAGACKEKVMRFLDQQKSITAGTIFPDVEGLGKFLHWHLETLMNTFL